MPIVITFDLSDAKQLDLHRVRSLFERFGWEHLNSTAYRYPRLKDGHHNEDWFNRVIPALMLLRALALAEGRGLRGFTIDVQSSTGYNHITDIGQPPQPAEQIRFFDPPENKDHFGRKKLMDWIDGITWPYK